MKRLLITLAAVATLLTPAHADAEQRGGAYGFNFRACHKYGGFISDGYVCIKAVIYRQNDGTGTYVARVHPFVYQSSEEDAWRACCPMWEPTAAQNHQTAVWSRSNPSEHTAVWTRTKPELERDNRCSVVYHPQVRVGRNTVEIYFDYTVQRPARPDSREQIGFRWNGYTQWGGTFDTDVSLTGAGMNLDAAIEAAARAKYNGFWGYDGWKDLSDHEKQNRCEDVRPAVEAAVPLIAAQALRDAADEIHVYVAPGPKQWLRARADDIENGTL